MTRAGDLQTLLAYPGRATRALVDLDALRHNASALLSSLDHGTAMMAVVKADGYGHGAVMVAREAVAAGATWLGVATVAEGTELRDAGLSTPTLILGPIDPSELDAATDAGLDVTVGQPDLVDALVDRSSWSATPIRLHVKVDTGMHRLGLSPADALSAIDRLEASRPGSVYGLCTHLACADDESSPLTAHQLATFDDVASEARRVVPGIVCHVANSAGTLRGVGSSWSIARVGIALYGCGVTGEQADRAGVRPAMSIVSRILRVHDLRPGDAVSYGSTYVASHRERVGLVPIGYADGYHRALSNRGSMTVGERAYPVRGRVCMDQTIVGGLPEATSVGEWVGVVGPTLGGPGWGEVAEAAGTIDYELLTSVGRRVARLYHRSGRLVSTRDERGRYLVVDDDNAPAVEQRPGRSRERVASTSRSTRAETGASSPPPEGSRCPA